MHTVAVLALDQVIPFDLSTPGAGASGQRIPVPAADLLAARRS